MTGRRTLRRRAAAPWPLALLLAAACETEPDPTFRLPWWPDVRVAAPSPLLDAVGLAPPALAGPGCHPGGSMLEEYEGLHGALTRLASGFEVTCFSPPDAAGGARDAGYAAAAIDGRGRTMAADRQSELLPAAAATASADSILRRGLALPGARRLACRMEGWPVVSYSLGGPEPTVRGWATPDYQALVSTYPARLDSADAHVVHLQVSRLPFAACLPRQARAIYGPA